MDDPAQLLAAIHQIQHLLEASLVSFTGLSGARDRTQSVAALEHAVQTMDFLHLAHRNLISELGSTQPIMRLVGSLDIARNKLMQVRSKVTAGTTLTVSSEPPTASGATSPTTLIIGSVFAIVACILLFAPPLSLGVLNLAVPLGLLCVLSVLSLFVWSAQYPFSASDSPCRPPRTCSPAWASTCWPTLSRCTTCGHGSQRKRRRPRSASTAARLVAPEQQHATTWKRRRWHMKTLE